MSLRRVLRETCSIPRHGTYEFCLDSDDGAKLWIGEKEIINNNGVHGVGWPKCATVELGSGKSPFKVTYFENVGLAALRLFWAPPGSDGARSIVPAAAFENGIRAEYFRECHFHKNIASLQLEHKQPARPNTVVTNLGIDFPLCDGYWCPNYKGEGGSCQEDASVDDSCLPSRTISLPDLQDTSSLISQGHASSRSRAMTARTSTLATICQRHS